MEERAFRLDFFIAIAALVVSILTTATLVYQTQVIRDQYAATIWPYVEIGANYSNREVSLTMANDGLGPALIRSAQILVDGKPVDTWNAYLATIPDQNHSRLSADSIDASTTLRPGSHLTLLRVAVMHGSALRAATAHDLELRFCYCSLNKSCWNLDDHPFSSKTYLPVQVGTCSTTSTIGVDAKAFS